MTLFIFSVFNTVIMHGREGGVCEININLFIFLEINQMFHWKI